MYFMMLATKSDDMVALPESKEINTKTDQKRPNNSTKKHTYLRAGVRVDATPWDLRHGAE